MSDEKDETSPTPPEPNNKHIVSVPSLAVIEAICAAEDRATFLSGMVAGIFLCFVVVVAYTLLSRED